MIDLTQLKIDTLSKFHENLEDPVSEIGAASNTHQKKAKLVNSLIADLTSTLKIELDTINSLNDKQNALLVLQYCTSVASLEYRHQVWPYEYMALSRRVGELWERFCCSAWDCPSKNNVIRISPPEFSTVSETISSRIDRLTTNSDHHEEIKTDVHSLLELIGEINMKEDEVFIREEVPHVIDFKSGFGSNEKGNTIRLQAVGRAYKLWNPDTVLLFLVRQEENNNYLDVIKRSGLWDVRCGDSAYKIIDEITGSDMMYIRENIIDFKADLSEIFWDDISSHLSDLSSYLNW